MTLHLRKLLMVVSVAFMTLAVSGVAWAGGDHYRHDRYGYGHHHQRHHYGHPLGPKHHYKRGYKKYGKKHHKHDDDDEELLIGLLVGGLVGYAISQSQQAYAYERNSYPSVTTLPPQEAYPATQYDYSQSGHTCLQEREYQTKVIVGGKEVDAYGTACLQPDGSWRRGPAQLVTY